MMLSLRVVRLQVLLKIAGGVPDGSVKQLTPGFSSGHEIKPCLGLCA